MQGLEKTEPPLGCIRQMVESWGFWVSNPALLPWQSAPFNSLHHFPFGTHHFHGLAPSSQPQHRNPRSSRQTCQDWSWLEDLIWICNTIQCKWVPTLPILLGTQVARLIFTWFIGLVCGLTGKELTPHVFYGENIVLVVLTYPTCKDSPQNHILTHLCGNL